MIYPINNNCTHSNHVKLGDAVLINGEWERDAVLLDQHGPAPNSPSPPFSPH